MRGKKILHYKIIEKLGEGGMGVVYLAEDTKLKRRVAIKFLPKHISANSDEQKRFEIEAQASAALNHPNIATIHSIETLDDPDPGNELKQRIEESPISINEALDIAIKIGEGLQATHERDIVHRDIKSANIMLTPKGQVKIMDFGLAKIKGSVNLTQAGSTVRTIAYMSPEQAQGGEVDRRSDIFSFGVVIYEMLTSQLPFQGEHQAAIIYSIVNEDPQPVARFNDKVSEDLERIIHKALAKDKEERYQHVDDILGGLKREKKASSGYIKVSAVAPVKTAKSPETIEAANKYINLAPAEPNPYDTRGDIYAWFMEYDSSRSSYQKALTLCGDFFSGYKIGFDALLRQQYEEAENYFARSGFRRPVIEIHRGQLKDAEKKLSELSGSQVSEMDRLEEMIHISYERGQYPKMLDLARQLSALLKKNPSSKIYGREYLAWALIKNGQSAEAHSIVNDIQKDVKGISPLPQVMADNSSALVSFEEGKNELALEKFGKVIKALPPNHEPNLFYGITLLKTEQISDAIAEFQRLLYWSGNNDIYIAGYMMGAYYYWPIQAVKAHYWVGVAYEKQNEIKRVP